MNSVRKWIRDVFGFSGNEINGFLILIPLMMAFIFSEPLYHAWIAKRVRDHSYDAKRFDSLIAVWPEPADDQAGTGVVLPAALFHFNPNTASVDDLRRLGLDERLSNRIAAYRRKGGVFTVKSDLLKIYGVDSALYNRLYGYIQLPSSAVAKKERSASAVRRETSDRSAVARKNKQPEQKFDINTADTLQLKSVYGIGSKLAARIIRFRDALGGFVRPDQLFEVYGLDSVTVSRLLDVGTIASDFTPDKININTASEKRLSMHPYISYRLARALVSYRFQHGDFPDVNDIKKLSALEPGELDRVLPYLKVKD